MKKLLGIMAVVALLAAPALAGTPVGVTINVEAYAEVTVPPAGLVMRVDDKYDAGTEVIDGHHQATQGFEVQTNAGCTLTLTANEVSVKSPVGDVPGMDPGNNWPTARVGGPGGTGAAIGYGVGIFNDKAGTSDGWTPATENCVLAFGAGVSAARVRINTYVDSGRSASVGYLAPVGTYAGTLTLTVGP